MKNQHEHLWVRVVLDVDDGYKERTVSREEQTTTAHHISGRGATNHVVGDQHNVKSLVLATTNAQPAAVDA